jgi:hypothetical protein
LKSYEARDNKLQVMNISGFKETEPPKRKGGTPPPNIPASHKSAYRRLLTRFKLLHIFMANPNFIFSQKAKKSLI